MVLGLGGGGGGGAPLVHFAPGRPTPSLRHWEGGAVRVQPIQREGGGGGGGGAVRIHFITSLQLLIKFIT